ncbi:hypothetical protein KPH14_004190 [Odynerus spinipes]|uniref:Secreted protein n=1 Tax=Odynerus spinipes TaxID=1348599 RepID=A0AAD9VVA1_9HYME|nr:hypothetical protein KPH14_004190 [Odynerus spinipes]
MVVRICINSLIFNVHLTLTLIVDTVSCGYKQPRSIFNAIIYIFELSQLLVINDATRREERHNVRKQSISK